MRVLYLIDSLGAGGAERSLAALAPHLVRDGVELNVAYFVERDGLRTELEAAGASVTSLAGRSTRAARVFRARRFMSVLEPDLVHTTLFEADVAGRVAARAAGIKVVSSLVNVAYGSEQLEDPNLSPWKIRAAQLVDGLTARLVTRFHAVTGWVADVMGRRLHLPRDRIDVVPRGRDPNLLGRRTHERRMRACKVLGVDDSGPVILAVGRQERQKGFDVLVQAMPQVTHRMPGASLLVAGREGNQSPYLNALVRKMRLGSAVVFLGSRSDVTDLMCAADVLAFPSRWEGMPGTLLEAMALEVPVVASDIPPHREVLGDHGGRFVPPERVEALATALIDSIQAPGESKTLTMSARTRFLQRFTINRCADAMLTFYDRALRGP